MHVLDTFMFRVANLRSLPAPSRNASCMYGTGLSLCLWHMAYLAGNDYQQLFARN